MECYLYPIHFPEFRWEQLPLPGLQIITCHFIIQMAAPVLLILMATLVSLFLPPRLVAELWFRLIKPPKGIKSLKMLQRKDHHLIPLFHWEHMRFAQN